MTERPVDRRGFLVSAAANLTLLSLTRRLHAVELAEAAPTATRELSFAHLHTGEHLDVAYWSGGHYIEPSLAAVDHVLRDWRTGEVHAIDPQLLDLLHDLRLATGTMEPFDVISGYRSPSTNRMLAAQSGGVATSSLHMDGRAIDIRLADVPLRDLRDAALDLRRGGVGYYPSSNFVHVDTGRFRTW